MKKLLAFFALFALVLGLITNGSIASAATQHAYSVAVKGKTVTFSSTDKPYANEGKEFLSATAVASQLGYTTAQVGKTYSIVKGTSTIQYTVGTRVFYINSKAYVLPRSVQLQNNKPFITEEFFRAALEQSVTYSSTKNQLAIGISDPVAASTAKAATAAAPAAPAAPAVTPQAAPTTLILYSTTSTRDSGLMDILGPVFEKKYNVKLVGNYVGTGDALAAAGRGDADVVLVHSPSSEAPYVSDGTLTDYHQLFYNDFILIGPKSNPAGVKIDDKPSVAFQKVGDGNYPFVSRNDASGTNSKELSIWKPIANGAYDYTKAKQDVQLYPNYIMSGAGMGAALEFANNYRDPINKTNGAYILSDRATWLNYSVNSSVGNLTIVNQMVPGDKTYLNIYHTARVSKSVAAKRDPKVELAAEQFVQFMRSSECSQLVQNYLIHGQAAFHLSPDGYQF